MPLYRKVRRAGGSVTVTIPADFAKAMGIEAGMDVEIVPMDSEVLAIRRRRSD